MIENGKISEELISEFKKEVRINGDDYSVVMTKFMEDYIRDSKRNRKREQNNLDEFIYNLIKNYEGRTDTSPVQKGPLTKEQTDAYNSLMSGRNVFLTGEAGTGKSYVLNYFIKQNEKAKKIITTSSTGISAINIDGVTLYRAFKIPIPCMGQNPKISKLDVIKNADVIIIDEISMVTNDVFDYVWKCLKRLEEVTKKKRQLIVCGDFLQLPPVIRKEDGEARKYFGLNEDGYAYGCDAWKDADFDIRYLHEPKRQNEKSFISALNMARSGKTECLTYFNSLSRKSDENDIILCPTNRQADEINQDNLDRIKMEEHIFEGETEGLVNSGDKANSDFVRLKIGARVMTLVNNEDNYQNGSLGTITGFKRNAVLVRMDNTGEVHEIAPYTWNINNYVMGEDNKPKKETVGSFTQIPLKLAYAITIHKSQGQTYDSVTVIPNCFSDGQLYVALSRVRSVSGLSIKGKILPNFLKTSRKTIEFYKGL